MNDPFKITGPAVVSFSGGRTSGMMLYRILEAHGGVLPADVKVVFCNTGKERPETLDFVERCSAEWGVEVVWVEYRHTPDGEAKHSFAVVDYATASRNGEPFAQLIEVRNFLPNPVSRFCTQELKIRPLEKWCRKMGWDRWTNHVGIRADEPHRLAKGRASAAKSRNDTDHPLARAGVSRAAVTAFWQSMPFDLQLEPHEGNCDLCFLKGRGRIIRILQDRPELADWWIEYERTVIHAGGGTDRFRRDRPSYAALLEHSRRPTLFPLDEADELSVACHCTD